MKAQTVITKFRDSPEPWRLRTVIDRWQTPGLPDKLQLMIQASSQDKFRELCRIFRTKLESSGGIRFKKQLEKSIIDWLYDFIRLNVKRGRIFDLREVLKMGHADCLGYAKLFTVLGRRCGLDMGVVEVIMDNRGRVVPHTATLVILPDGSRQFIDFWYGSKDVHHKRLGLRVKHNAKWRIEDIDFKALKEAEEASYLPDYCVDAITLYIEGNRSLNKKDYVQAIRQYSRAIRLYPQNSRAFYNRAIARENLGQTEKAQADYARALQDDSSLLRTLATEPPEIVDLLRLDERNIAEQTQEIYLINKGFITGRKVALPQIALRMDLSLIETKAILDSVESVVRL